MTKTLREKYFENEILKIGDIVEDSSTGKSLKIIDRGSNYITVDGPDGISKKWLSEVIDTTDETKKEPKEFQLTENNQIKMFGYTTKNFDKNISEFILEQFSEFVDTYSKHQIIKLFDIAIVESNCNRKFDLLNKITKFYTSQNIEEPIILEGMKNELERRRIVEILATIANSPVDKSIYKTATDAVIALKEKFTKRTQWEVLYPFLKMANSAGIAGIMQNLPYRFDDTNKESNPKLGAVHEEIIQIMEDNFEELLESLDETDLLEAFSEDELTTDYLTEEQLNEVLSYETRLKLGRKMKNREANLEVKRARALTKSASTDVLQSRARKLAETMLKFRMFRKDPGNLTRQEKERFESGAGKRKVLVARLAMRLISKVRAIQSNRLHNRTEHPGNSVPQNSLVPKFGAS